MNNLAVVYDDLERYDDAAAIYRQVIEIRSRVLGPMHADTLDTRNNLGVTLRRMGRVDEAAEEVETAAFSMRETLGLEHRWTLRCTHHLVALWAMLGRVDEARPLMRDVLETRLRRAEAADATATDKHHIAWDLLTCEVEDLRDPPRALELARAAATMTDQRDPGVLDTLAMAWDANGDRARAIETQRRAIALVPEDDPDRAELEATLARYRE
jgi:tetratricopeptide (TPR) repeat protein